MDTVARDADAARQPPAAGRAPEHGEHGHHGEPDRALLFERLEARRRSLRLAAQTPSRTDDALRRVTAYTRDNPWPTLAGALLGGAVLGRLVRKGGVPLMLSLAVPVIRRHVVPRLVARFMQAAQTTRGARPLPPSSPGSAPPL